MLIAKYCKVAKLRDSVRTSIVAPETCSEQELNDFSTSGLGISRPSCNPPLPEPLDVWLNEPFDRTKSGLIDFWLRYSQQETEGGSHEF